MPISDRDPRRWQERADSRLIQEDHQAMANLSPKFINREVYHNSPVYGPNSIYGGDREMSEAFYAILQDKQ